MRKILIITPVQSYLNTLSQFYEFDSYPSVFPVSTFKKKNTDIFIVSFPVDEHGEEIIGLNIASAVAVWAIKEFDPDIIINTGTAVSFKEQSSIGEVYSVGMVRYAKNLSRSYLYVNNFDSDINNSNEASLFSFACYPIDLDDDNRREITKRARSLPVLMDTEGAAIAQVSSFLKKKVIFLKSIIGNITDDYFEQFEKNFPIATHNLVVELEKLLEEESI